MALIPGGRYAVLALGVLGFIASAITMYGAWATFTKTPKDDPWARRIKAGYYTAWAWAIKIATLWRRVKREQRTAQESNPPTEGPTD